jgi:glycine/D-amino acid oxidase-like deaminating enzyme
MSCCETFRNGSAGAIGLFAAHDLLEEGISVAVIEKTGPRGQPLPGRATGAGSLPKANGATAYQIL